MQRVFIAAAAAAAGGALGALAREIRRWRVRCPCGREASVAAIVGLKFRPGRQKTVTSTCRECGRRRSLPAYRK